VIENECRRGGRVLPGRENIRSAERRGTIGEELRIVVGDWRKRKENSEQRAGQKEGGELKSLFVIFSRNEWRKVRWRN
jgi:hypothetical protein